MLYIIEMFAKIMKSKIDGKNMTAIFYENDTIPIMTVDFGADGYDDYTVAPHDKDQKARLIKDTWLMIIRRIAQQPALSQDIFLWDNKI